MSKEQYLLFTCIIMLGKETVQRVGLKSDLEIMKLGLMSGQMEDRARHDRKLNVSFVETRTSRSRLSEKLQESDKTIGSFCAKWED